ncbi:MAG: hypothetical protein Q7T82_03150 [Armatimonadota bacterium]|nr:hypothetical protein [Armatimonadota bacterium]
MTSTFEAAYRNLERIASGQIDDESISELKRALNGKGGLLAAKAAEIVGSRNLRDLIPDMIAAFERFARDGAKTDKQCAAKIAIADVLNKLEYMGDEVFLAGAYHAQSEPSFGMPIDSAIKLRCACAYGLARIGHPNAHHVLADLLVDPEDGVRVRFTNPDPEVDAEYEVRAAAAKALAYMGTPEAELLLRLKVLTGDKRLEVISECFTGLMAMAPDRSLDFVGRFLQSDNPPMAESAALAIGTSRAPGAYDALRRGWDANLSPAFRRILLLPMALARSDEGFDFLIEVLRKADGKMASEALRALSLYADDDSVRRIGEAVKARGETEMLRNFEAEFGGVG